MFASENNVMCLFVVLIVVVCVYVLFVVLCVLFVFEVSFVRSFAFVVVCLCCFVCRCLVSFVSEAGD